MKLPLRALVLVSLVLTLACGGGGGGGSTPTTPPSPQGSQVAIGLGVTVLGFSGAVQEAIVLLDGREVGRRDWTNAGNCVGGCLVDALVQNVAAGSHTVEFRVVRQTRTTVSYAALGALQIIAANGSRRTVDLPRRDVSLRAGQGVSYTFSV